MTGDNGSPFIHPGHTAVAIKSSVNDSVFCMLCANEAMAPSSPTSVMLKSRILGDLKKVCRHIKSFVPWSFYSPLTFVLPDTLSLSCSPPSFSLRLSSFSHDDVHL